MDEATPQERALISSYLDQISDMAQKLGYQDSFRSIPVLVTSEDEIANMRSGYCQKIGDQKLIVVNRVNFLPERNRRVDAVFSVLLHEIGHCYFNRMHDKRLLEKPGHYLNIKITDEKGGESWLVPGFPVSIMYQGDRVCGSSCPVSSSSVLQLRELQNYYVAEMLGVRVLKDPNDLSEFKSVRWVEKSPEPIPSDE